MRNIALSLVLLMSCQLVAQNSSDAGAAYERRMNRESSNSSQHSLKIADGLFQAKPLTDLRTDLYLNQYQGGLYENGRNIMPGDHLSDGLSLDTQIADGTPFVFLGIGMSDAENTFSAFMSLAGSTLGLNPQMTMVDGGQGSYESCQWAYAEGDSQEDNCPTGPGIVLPNPYDNVQTARLAPANCGTAGHQQCFSESDVRVVLYYDADSCRLGKRCAGLPSVSADAFLQEQYEGMMARAVKQRYPNARKLFIVSREYAGYATLNINPEPYAYENGFAAKWTIAAQIIQVRTGLIDPTAGDLSYNVSPWIAWGPYTWASGETARTDGLFWCQGQQDSICYGEMDFQSDGTHLSKSIGRTKWANLALSLFLREFWFRAPTR
jgi:hypothetical protein